MSALQELAPGLHRWSEFSEEKQLNFNGYYLAQGGEAVLIDPPELDADTLHALKDTVARTGSHPLKAILLTNVHHDRASRRLKDVFQVPIHIHENDKPLLEFSPDATFKDGDTLPCGLRVIHLQNQKSPGESALLQKEKKWLFVGDALIGKVPGKVNQLPPDKFDDITKAREGLKVLLNYEFDDLLLGDGEPIRGNARQTLDVFFTD
ncbi:MBL fold metallo-hydrolase [Nitrospina gracilis]|uniref:MBL fold metallo-hydrolase n=1 Tax=Nitrospina gracilis TaxID=35801 RepID=UPI001F188E22|nr:hypothetical protein [Nitrospina gracilis]MCF8721269.1 glyoxylase-like metal-dependent hydrolase (beta-lactamase superfamily II) [Nitrospina gracilis Nb-211]